MLGALRTISVSWPPIMLAQGTAAIESSERLSASHVGDYLCRSDAEKCQTLHAVSNGDYDFKIASQRGLDLGMALGSISGSLGESIGIGEGVGISSGVSTVPLFVVSTPPESVTSSTR